MLPASRRLPWLALAALLGLAGALLGARGGARPGASPSLTVNVEGRRWWWEIRYPEVDGGGAVASANELHVPVGRPVKLTLTARDVIHSFWVPGLLDRTDVVPGRRTEATLLASHPGVYRGQCAEFCGEGHGRMTFVVVAEDEASYRAWLDAQRAPAPATAPATAEARRGRDVFLASSCVLCHAVRGTPAAAAHAPDLTHVASRRTLGARALPRARGHVQEWLARPAARPGASVPVSAASPSDLQALMSYLETLR